MVALSAGGDGGQLAPLLLLVLAFVGVHLGHAHHGMLALGVGAVEVRALELVLAVGHLAVGAGAELAEAGGADHVLLAMVLAVGRHLGWGKRKINKLSKKGNTANQITKKPKQQPKTTSVRNGRKKRRPELIKNEFHLFVSYSSLHVESTILKLCKFMILCKCPSGSIIQKSN